MYTCTHCMQHAYAYVLLWRNISSYVNSRWCSTHIQEVSLHGLNHWPVVVVDRERIPPDDGVAGWHVWLRGDLLSDLDGVGHRQLGLHEVGPIVGEVPTPRAMSIQRLHVLHCCCHILLRGHAPCYCVVDH